MCCQYQTENVKSDVYVQYLTDILKKQNHSISREDVTKLNRCRKMHILYKGEYSCYLGKEKNVKGCFPCEQFSVVHVSHGTIGISRASTIKRIQNILGKVE